MAAAADRIIKRVRGKGRGWAFTPKDFLDLGTRASVDMALSRLAQQGHIRRIGRGLYDYPKLHAKLGALKGAVCMPHYGRGEADRLRFLIGGNAKGFALSFPKAE